MIVVQELVGDVQEADRSQVDSLEGILKKKRRKRQAGAKEDVTRVRMCWGYAAGSGTRWFKNQTVRSRLRRVTRVRILYKDQEMRWFLRHFLVPTKFWRQRAPAP